MKRNSVREAHRPAAAGTGGSPGPLLGYLLQRLEQGPDPTILGLDLKRFPAPELERLIADRVVVRIADATEVECEVSCGKTGLCHVDARSRPIRIVCRENHVPPREVDPSDIRQYLFSVRRFISRLCEANTIIRDETWDVTNMGANFFSVGRWNTAGRTYTVYLALGLSPDSFEVDVELIARTSGAKPLILSPTFRVASPAFQRILRCNNAALWTLADVMSPAYELHPTRSSAPAPAPAREPPAPKKAELVLVIDRSAMTVTFKGHPVELPRMRVQMLIALAERPGHVVPHRDLDRLLYPNAIVEPGQLTDHKGKILAAFRKQLVNKGGITRAEIDSLIETKSRVGYRLSLSQDQVELV